MYKPETPFNELLLIIIVSLDVEPEKELAKALYSEITHKGFLHIVFFPILKVKF